MNRKELNDRADRARDQLMLAAYDIAIRAHCSGLLPTPEQKARFDAAVTAHMRATHDAVEAGRVA